MKDSTVAIGGGRQLSYTDVGDPNGRCILYFHGAPMSRLDLVRMDADLAARRLRVISPDRPGYGESSPVHERSIADWPDDVAVLADALAIRRFAVAGHSSGGPYAVACAALLPSRVSAALVIAGATDMGWPGGWDGYLEGEKQLMAMSDEKKIVDWCREHFGADGSGFLDAFEVDLPEADHLMLADEQVSAALGACLAEAFKQGVAAYAQDIFLQGGGWPFDAGSITVPVEVVHGDADTIIPADHGRHTADVIPGARFRLLPGDGHFSILSKFPTLVAELAGG